MTKVFVHIVSFDNPTTAFDCATSVLKSTSTNNSKLQIDVHITDNYSSKKNREALKILTEDSHMIGVHPLPRNVGFAAAHNHGLNQVDVSTYDFVWLLNNDCLVEPDALSSMLNSAVENKEVDIWGATLMESDRDTVQLAGGCTYSRWLSTYKKVYSGKKRQDIPLLESVTLDYVAGASMFFPISTLVKLKHTYNHQTCYLNSRFFLYFEELDMAARLRFAKLQWCKNALIYHVGGHSTQTVSANESKVGVYHASLSALIYTRLHHPLCLLTVIPFRFVAMCLQLFIKKQPKLIMQLLKAYWHFFKDGVDQDVLTK